MLYFFKANGNNNYAVDTCNLLAPINASLTPQMSHRLVYNRTYNLQVEIYHLIYRMSISTDHLKINIFHLNIVDSSAARSSQGLGPMTEMLHTIDLRVHVKKPSGGHIGPHFRF